MSQLLTRSRQTPHDSLRSPSRGFRALAKQTTRMHPGRTTGRLARTDPTETPAEERAARDPFLGEAMEEIPIRMVEEQLAVVRASVSWGSGLA
jgi:hypothetical protein